VLIGAAEEAMHTNTWRNPDESNKAYFTTLDSYGYRPVVVEQLVKDPTADAEEDADGGDGDDPALDPDEADDDADDEAEHRGTEETEDGGGEEAEGGDADPGVMPDDGDRTTDADCVDGPYVAPAVGVTCRTRSGFGLGPVATNTPTNTLAGGGAVGRRGGVPDHP
jgi:hypothetical protein